MNPQTPREILSKFYLDNNLGDDGGNSSSSVKIEITKNFHFYFPNFNARRKAVIKHDIHHLLTGYTTTLFGESEISAWEIASGCKKYWVAFIIDTSGMMIGIPLNFMGVLKAFARGRRTKNLYQDVISSDDALDTKIEELQKLFLLDKHPIDTKPAFIDFVLFTGFVLYGTIYSILSLLLLPFIIGYSIYIAIKNKF
jgi:ubiquinone biosynthesis protein Coq4